MFALGFALNDTCYNFLIMTTIIILKVVYMCMFVCIYINTDISEFN